MIVFKLRKKYSEYASEREYLLDRRIAITKMVVAHYSQGTMCCKCCGEKELIFLTIDHINGGGNKQRISLSGNKRYAGHGFYEWLIKNKYPEGFQILCMNCNFGKHRNGGICPHSLK